MVIIIQSKNSVLLKTIRSLFNSRGKFHILKLADWLGWGDIWDLISLKPVYCLKSILFAHFQYFVTSEDNSIIWLLGISFFASAFFHHGCRKTISPKTLIASVLLFYPLFIPLIRLKKISKAFLLKLSILSENSKSGYSQKVNKPKTTSHTTIWWSIIQALLPRLTIFVFSKSSRLFWVDSWWHFTPTTLWFHYQACR